MRFQRFGPEIGREVTRYGSRGLRAVGLLNDDEVHVTVLHLEPGGEIGRHPVVVPQLFLVVAGRGAVSGADRTWHPIAAGEGVLWDVGEEHATQAIDRLIAVVIEGGGLLPAR